MIETGPTNKDVPVAPSIRRLNRQVSNDCPTGDRLLGMVGEINEPMTEIKARVDERDETMGDVEAIVVTELLV